MRKMYTKWIIALLLVITASLQTLHAQTISNTTPNSTYTEHAPAIVLHPNFTVTGGSGFGGGYMLFDLTNGSLGDQLGIKSDANPNAVGAISVSGTGIFLGNGTSTNIIGSIDGVMNGQNGQKLKINFTSNFSNPSFETGLTGWTTGNTQVKLGSTVLAGFTTPADPNNPSNTTAGDTRTPTSASFTASVSTSEKTNGAQSLWLYSTMTTAAGCDVVHGPYAYSAPFQSNAGDVLSFDWRAIGGNDAYDVFCYIVNTSTGVATICLNQTGASASAATPWATVNVAVPATGTYRFVFISGTWDQTCGRAAGASLYVDNVKVFGDNVTPDIISAIAKRVTYRNDCGTSSATRNLSISLVKQDNSSTSTSSTINLVTYAPVAIAQNITAALGTNGQVTVAPSSVNNGSTDDCSMTFTLSQSTFTCANLGDNPVVLTVKDPYGNTSTANAVITIVDNTKPTINCPSNITVNNSAGQCGANVNYSATITDNCGTPNITYSIPSGSFFPRGATNVTITATDNSGNTNTCTFVVTVVDNEKPVVTQSTLPTVTGQCSATVSDVPTATDNCAGLINGVASGPTSFNTQGTYTIVWSYNDGNGNITTQNQTVVVKDDMAPVAPALDTIRGECSATATAPVATDNCSGNITGTTTDTVSFTAQGTYTIHWNFTDAAGNTATAAQTVIVKDVTAPIITGCPSDITVNAADGECSAVVNWNPPTASDNCPGVSVSTNHIPGESFNVGATTVTYTATDHTGLTSTCTFTVTVVDNQPPVINCPAAITVSNDAGVCGATVAVATATATDNCPGVTVTGVRNDGQALTALYPVGTTTITWTATDAHNNTTTCTQLITVNDTEKPVITCGAAVTHTANLGLCSYSFTPSSPLVSDNCAGVTLTGLRDDQQSLTAPYPVGTTIITWTATDAHQNVSTCTQVITITDDQNPIIQCPANGTYSADPGSCTYSFVPATPTATDNCPGVTVTGVRNDGQALNAPYPSGLTTITWTATDAHGHTASCTQTITVTDTEKPTIVCAAPQTLNLDANCSATIPDFTNQVTVSDNCTAAGSLVITQFPAAGSVVNGTGTVVVTITVKDAAGNTNTCSVEITKKDVTPPTIVCAAPIAVNNDAGKCGAVVNFTAPTATDNCGGQSSVSTFNFTGSVQSFTAPVSGKYTFELWGAQGGSGGYYSNPNASSVGGKGGYAKGEYTLTAGQTIQIYVGGQGQGYPSPSTRMAGTPAKQGGYNGGGGSAVDGVSGTGGGGASDIRIGGSALGNRVIVAGGGGGGGNAYDAVANSNGGAGGGLNGITMPTSTQFYGRIPGAGATQTTGYALGMGQTAPQNLSGGGGGGYYGGSAGENSTGGGGGSSYINGVANGITTADVQTGNGKVTVSWRSTSVSFTQTEGLPSGSMFPVGVTTNTFVARDSSGNESTCSFTVTVTDTQKPVLVGVPANTTVECNAVPVPAMVTATDNCTTSTPTYTEVRTNGNCPSSYTLTRTWTTTDASNNTTTATQVITVQDTQAPVLSAAPADITVECDAVPAPAVLTATDNCDTPTVVYSEVRTNGNSPSNYTLKRTWTATDACGNTSSKTQTITVHDTQAPVISAAPADTTVECNAVPAPAVLTAADNCDTPTVVYSEVRTNGNCPSSYTLTRTWTSTDASGNTSTKTQVITVQDTQAPVLSAAPEDVTVECDAVPAPEVLTATDNCDTPTVVYSEVRTNGNSPSNYILKRTWTATDACGNTSSKTQTITVHDTQAPVISAAPADTTVECDAVPAPAVLTATDNCDTPTVVYSEVRTNGNCPSSYTLTRTWTSTDASGNTSTKTQVITVQDTQAPVLSIAPADTTVECNAVPAPAVLTATDNCDTPTVVYSEVRTNGNSPSNYTLTRTWTATDACGNTSSKTQTITVHDTQAPVISAAPADTTVECNAVPAPAVLTATDNCDTPTVVYSEVRTNGNCPSSYTLTRTWTSTDASGNTSSKTQVITVQDTQAPVLSIAPADTTVECDAVPAPAVLTATDNCDTPTVVYNEVRTNGNSPSNYTLTRTWTATDACGNTSSKTQTITVHDTQAPVISAAPADTTVECNAVPAPAVLTATDNCDTPTVVYSEVRTNGNCPSSYTLTRTWTSTDASGNTSSKTQVIAVQDTQAPVLSIAPADTTVECDAVPAPAVLTATDNCDTPTVVYSEVRTNGNSPSNYTLTRTWTATDACGNTSSKTQTITVHDTQAPVISAAPADTTVECNAVPAPAVLTATDNCDTPTVVYSEVRTNGNCPSNYTLTRTWTSTDASGNTSSKTQVITVQDTQAPVLTAAPDNITVSCDAVPAPAVLTATDNCDTPTVVYSEVRTNGSSAYNYTLTRTWTATDACGNTSSKTQVITVRDTQAPVPTITELPTLTGDCSVTATAPTALDNCAGLITATTVNPTSYTAQGVYTITWEYNDGQGNTFNQEQRVVVKDQSGPIPTIATLPVISGQCATVVTTTPTATDACSGVTAPGTTNDPLSYSVQGTYTIHWTYTDNYGNTTVQEQTVIVNDNIAPVPNQASLPVIEGQCSVNITMVTSTRCTDNCFCCRNVCHCRTSACNCRNWSEWLGKLLSYFWGGAFDNNHGCDHDEEVDDVNNLKMQAPTATDNCKGTIVGTTTDPLSYTSQGTYTIHWMFNDGNGNTSIQEQTVIVKDVEAPVPNAHSLPTVYGICSATVTNRPTARDNCKGTITGTTTDPLTYTSNGTYTIHWTFSDGNGNVTTQNQTVIVNDNIKPILREPNHITISCGSSTEPSVTGMATATDNCSAPEITYTDVVNGNRITRTWKATDAAGNYTTDVQYITLTDNVKPVITAPSHITVGCGSSATPAATGMATATDNCSTPVISYSDHTSNNGYTITRTWKATDAAGNTATASQVITIVDSINPTIVAPADITISCNASTTPYYCGGSATGSDNCSNVTITYTDAKAGNVITRTWKATDASGNVATDVQLITIADNTKPVISDVRDITISCGASTSPSSCGSVPTATDNCGTPVVTYSDVTNGNVITRTWKATDAAGNTATSTQIITIGSAFSVTLSSVPTNNTYTGGVSTNLYLGYGAQSTTLTMCNLPSSGAPYTYNWSGSSVNRLSSSTSASPLFTPATSGYYTFSVTVTNKNGCSSTAVISICVTDIRVPGTNGAKVYICHTPNGKNKTPQTLQVALNQVSQHLNSYSYCGSDGDDRLGSCDQSPCNAPVVNTVAVNVSGTTRDSFEDVSTKNEDFKVTVLPNPSTTYFTLKLESKYETPVNLRVMDASGRVIDAKTKIGSNSTIQVGHNYASGLYYAELIQGKTRKVVQMIKSKG